MRLPRVPRSVGPGAARLGAVAFLTAATLWPVAIVGAPYAALDARPGTAAYDAAAVVYLVGSTICHQRAERSFHDGAVQWPVCARCAGIYLAAPFGALAALLVARDRRPRRRRLPVDAADPRWRPVIIAAALPTLVTVVMEWTTGQMTPALLRAAAGVPIGFAVAWFVTVALVGAGRVLE